MHDSQSNPILRFGCCGWDNPGWAASYFPDDLPPEWRLTYYANDAGCVLVPMSEVAGMAGSELAAMAIDELHEGFRFYLDAIAPGPPCARAIESLGHRLAAVISDRPGAPALATTVLAPTPAPDGRAWSHRGHALLRLDDSGPELRAWRRRFEDLQSWLRSYDEVAVIVQGDRITPCELGELKVVAELLGIA